VPQGEEKVVFDWYHLMRHMVKAVDTVRRPEARASGAERRRLGSFDRDKVSVAVLAGKLAGN